MSVNKFDDGSIPRLVKAQIKEFKETKKSKETNEEFAIAICEDLETGESFKLIMGMETFAVLKDNDTVYLKYYFAKRDTYEEDMFVLTKGKHGQMILAAAKK